MFALSKLKSLSRRYQARKAREQALSEVKAAGKDTRRQHKAFEAAKAATLRALKLGV